MGMRMFRGTGGHVSLSPLCSLMLALLSGPGWHQGVLLTAGAEDVGRSKVAPVQDARSVHDGGPQVGCLAHLMLRLK